ncbi:MAG: 16S rRNA (adenine(1518)-N(6)/adenine(1519)-N(6))-dimethyltransferase RsmA [Candidatus Micrarchaeia archaeon]|jgi:16S rRNA (adenine1518-N6/adenine1519-N6)-dimethyltransferase
MLDFKPKKRLGQSFLVNRNIAKAEAVHGAGKIVIEMGPGLGVLTKELCKVAKKVIAVELDPDLYSRLGRELKSRKLKLINKDFFEATSEELELENAEIMIANIPYQLSSKTIEFLSSNSLPAVLCLQKEFVEHMLAKPGERSYSKLSVVAQLSFRLSKIMDVSRGNFNPVPKVDSSIVLIEPKRKIDKATLHILSALMEHKKKTVKNAIEDAAKELGISKGQAKMIAQKISNSSARVFKLSPESLLSLAEEIGRVIEESNKAPESVAE